MSRFTNHTSSSSYLQAPTSSQLPPSSFRQTGGGLRNSLKKIPSSLFGEKSRSKEKEKMSVHMDDITTTIPRAFRSSAIPAFLSNNASPPRADKSKLQKKTKTRKGLGEIFGWSNNNNTSNPPTITAPIISAPSALLPSPPRFQREMPMPRKENVMPPLPKEKENFRPNQARRTSSKSSIPGLAGWAALRPPAETPARARPSMAADPFGRTEVGAERVDQIQQCGELFERRESVSSGKAFSTKTIDSSDQSKRASVSSGKALSSKTFGHDRLGSITSSKAISTKTVDSDYTIKYQGQAEIRRARHMSPVPARATLVELPSRANSTVRRPSIPIPSPRQLASAQSVEKVNASPKAIKKEKTKSRVWGLLGMRSKKSEDVLTKTTAPVEPAASAPVVKQDKDTLTPSRVPKRVSSIHALQAHGSTKYSSRSAMHWPPSLHITQPSVDVQAGPSTASTFESFKPGDDFNPGSTDIAALMSGRSMPKRKLLNGLFGVSLKEAERFKARHMEPDDDEEVPVIQASPPYISRFAEVGPSVTRSNTLRRVASATDKLVDLVTAFEFSPVSRKTITPMESLSSIAETIKEAHDGSPTPMRKVKSGVLSIRGASPMRQGPNVSPLRLAIHRKQLEAPSREVLRKKSSKNIFAPTARQEIDINATIRPSPLQNQVVKVTVSVETAARTEPQPFAALPTALPPPPRPNRRNIFAPPPPQVTAASLASLVQSDKTVGKPQLRPVSCGSAFTDRVEHDVPQDLRDLFIDADHILSATTSPAHVAGLPQPPPSDRRPVAGRRRRNPPPAALPPSPPTPVHAHLAEHQQRPRGSAMSEFDFDAEFANLDRGDQRASFVEALHRAQGDYHSSHDLPPLPPLPGHVGQGQGQEFSMNQFDDASSERASRSSTDTVVVAAAARRSPFMGTFAFQQHASTIKGPNSPPLPDVIPEIQIQQEDDEQEQEYSTFADADANADAEDDTMELAPPPPTRRNQQGHRRDESGLSIATMSSIGEVIETGIAGDYTNYFEAEFARDNAKRQHQPSSSGFDFTSSAMAHSRQSSVASNTSGRHRRGHSRNTSIASLTSIDGLDHSTLPGPPVSMHNRKRSTYISKHRQSGSSSESAFGRSDWAATHRRNQSEESVMSNMSASRIGRPGLGDRMFQLDGGVQLTSITGSPADGYDQDEQDRADEVEAEAEAASESGDEAILNMSKSTYYTAYIGNGGEDSFHTARDASFSRESEAEAESSSKESDWNSRPVSSSSTASGYSIFGPGPVHHKGSFLLRPISAITTDSSSNEEDTFINVSRSIQIKRAPSCIEAQGEDTMTPVNIARPRKPRSDRRRHVQLALESDLETPGLTSPSTSEASSRMSLETRFSEGPATRSFFAGHRRQQSSVVVQPQATIREEPSNGNLRPQQSPLEWKEVGTVRSYLDWEREADVECQRVKAQWKDSEESRIAIQDLKNQMPASGQAISEFLAQSAMKFGSLEQSKLPKAHRRKSSLSEARASLSPYGHLLARPPIHGGTTAHVFSRPPVKLQVATEGQPQKKRVSLITKFERTNSAASSHFPSDDEPVSQPSSAIFAQFTRETPPTPPPVLMELPSMSPFKLNLSTGYSPVKKPLDKEKEKRSRVDSEVRRQALGWGKRRNSDGPAKVIAAEPPVPRIPLAFIRPRTVLGDKENIRPNGSPTKKSSVVKKPTRRVPRLASVPKGLRA